MAISGVQAQRTVDGTVRNSKDSKGMPFANVALMRASDSTFFRGTTTDVDGRFTLTVDTFATFLRVSVVGYETAYLPVNEGDATIDVVLKEGSMTLDEVSIVAKKPLYSSDGDKKIYNVSEDPTIQNGSAQDALQNSPGVQVDGDGNITLNGKAVKVYINDKESHYEGEMLKQYIKTLTADQISSIEAIEYPSAKYGGGGPVINIRTEQKLLKNSYLSFGGYGSTEPSFSPFVSYAYANEKMRFNAYVRYSGDHYKDHSDGESKMFDENGNMVRESSDDNSGEGRSTNTGVSLSFGYDFDTMNTLSAYFSTSPYWGSSENDGRTVRRDLLNGLMQDYSYSYHSDSRGFSVWGYGSADFEHKFNNEGHKISFNLGGNFGIWNSSGTHWDHYDLQPQMSYDQRTKSHSPNSSIDLGINYSFPYSEKGELSAGLNFSHSTAHSYYLRDTLDLAGLYHCDALRSDTSDSYSNDASLYLSWQRKWGNFTLRVGGNLSYESGSSAHQEYPQYDTAVHYWEVSPNILLMYNTENGHSIDLSYSTSLSQPSATDLSRYESYGIESYSTGNPSLEASRSHLLSLGYDKYFEAGHSLGLSGSFNAGTNAVANLSWPEYVPFFGRYVSYSKPFNGVNSRKASLYVYARYRFSANLSVTLSGGAEDDWYSTLVRPDERMEDEMASWNIRLSARARLFKVVWLSASTHYSSRSHGWDALDIDEPNFGADLSASADFFNRKLSVYVNVNDIFNTEGWNTSSINPYMPSTDNYKYNSQYISFGVTLRFGKMELGNSRQEGIQSGGSGKGGK